MGGWVGSFTVLLILSSVSFPYIQYVHMGLGRAGFNLAVLVTGEGATQPTGDEHGPNLKEIRIAFKFLHKSNKELMKQNIYSFGKSCQTV